MANFDFDFAVRTPSPIISATPGQSVSVPIMVAALRGNPQPVQLNVASNWGGAGIVAQVVPSEVPPGGPMATLYVVVSATTPPGSYIFGVQGTTQGTFKSSEAMVTVVVSPVPSRKDKQPDDNGVNNPPDEDRNPIGKGQKLSARSAPGKMGSRPAPRSPAGAIMTVVMLGALGFGGYYLNQQTHFIDSLLGSTPAATSDVSTYEGTQTFTMYSALGGSPMSNSGPASIQIDNAGDVLGPVLFGKITNGVFTGDARAQDGTVFHMTGTFSNGVLKAEYRSTSVSWVWNLHKAG